MKGDFEHPSGSEDWRSLRQKLISLKKYLQYLTLWVPIKKPDSQQIPTQRRLFTSSTRVRRVLSDFTASFLMSVYIDCFIFHKKVALPLLLCVSFSTECQTVCAEDQWRQENFVWISILEKKNLDSYLAPYTKLIKYAS